MTEFTLNAYSLVFSDHVQAKRLEYGNKILISSTILPDLDLSAGPTLFQIKSQDNVVFTSMHEYVDTPGICFVPHRLLGRLGVADGEQVVVSQVKDIPTGEFLKIKPFETAFTELADPKAVLEKVISTNYPVLSQGEIIVINYLDSEYHIEITECKPDTTIQTINCDINLEFEQPYDFVEKMPAPPEPQPELESPPDPRFPGVGRKLGSA
tara:strand:+ start:114 stop:743 length:630 start_codon:yes stop_codon:yes gene_type:complete